MAEPQITPEMQQQVQQLQQMAGQLQQLGQQRQQMEAMKAEADQAVEALEAAATDAPVWRAVGAVLVQEKDRDAALERIKEEQETLEIRIKRFRTQESEMQARFQKLQEDLQKAFGQ